jgi:hypothetical protein
MSQELEAKIADLYTRIADLEEDNTRLSAALQRYHYELGATLTTMDKSVHQCSKNNVDVVNSITERINHAVNKAHTESLNNIVQDVLYALTSGQRMVVTRPATREEQRTALPVYVVANPSRVSRG